MKLKLLFPLLILFWINSNAQDYIFYQFQNSPVYLSPTLSGTSINSRINLSYENDIGIGSFDTPFVLGNGDILGIGTRFLFQKRNRNNKFLTLGFNVNYQKRIFKSSSNNHYIVFGVDAALAQRRNKFHDNLLFSDFSSGIAWRSKFKNKFSIHIGTTLFHLNKPNQSSDKNFHRPLDKRFGLHGIIDIPIGKRILLSPSFLYTVHESCYLLITKSEIKYAFDKEKKSYIIFGLGIESISERSAKSMKMDNLNYKLGFQNNRFGVHIFAGDYATKIKLFQKRFWEGRLGLSVNYHLYKNKKQ